MTNRKTETALKSAKLSDEHALKIEFQIKNTLGCCTHTFQKKISWKFTGQNVTSYIFFMTFVYLYDVDVNLELKTCSSEE